MDMCVDAACRQNAVLARHCIGGVAQRERRRDAVHRVRIACLADTADQAILDADIGLHDALDRVDDRHVGDDEIGRTVGARQCVVERHPFPNAFTAAEDDFVAEAAKVLLDLDVQIRIAKADPIAGRRSEQARMLAPGNFGHG